MARSIWPRCLRTDCAPAFNTLLAEADLAGWPMETTPSCMSSSAKLERACGEPMVTRCTFPTRLARGRPERRTRVADCLSLPWARSHGSNHDGLQYSRSVGDQRNGALPCGLRHPPARGTPGHPFRARHDDHPTMERSVGALSIHHLTDRAPRSCLSSPRLMRTSVTADSIADWMDVAPTADAVLHWRVLYRSAGD